MREKFPRLVPQDDPANRALGALQDEKKLTDAERYKARGVKSKEELMELAKMNAAKIRARALELQETERKEAQEKRDARLASLDGEETLLAKYPPKVNEAVEKKPKSLDVLKNMPEITIDEEKEKEDVRILEEKIGRPMTKSSFDEKERKLAEKNRSKVIPVEEKKEKVVAKPENSAYATKAKENARKISERKIAERSNKSKEKSPEPSVAVEGKVDDTLSYEDYGVPLQGNKVETPKFKEPKTEEVIVVPHEVEKSESVLVQKHEDMVLASEKLQKFGAAHGIKMGINPDNFEIENYESLLKSGPKKLNTDEEEGEFYELLRKSVVSRNRFLSEENIQKRKHNTEALSTNRKPEIDSEAKTVEVPQYITEKTLKVPEFDEDDLPVAEEVVVEASPTVEVRQEIERTQEVDMEQEKLEFIERELKKRWVDLLRKRRVVRQILINREGLEFDAPIPEKFTYTTEGLLPQNAREMMRLAREKGTKEQAAYLQEFLSDVAEYIDYLEEWEKSVGKGDTQEIAQDTEEEEAQPKGERKIGKRLYELGDKKVRDIQNEFSEVSPEQLGQKIIATQKQIIDRFPWVEFHLDTKPGHEAATLDHYKISNWEAIKQSKIYQNNGGEDLDNGKLGVKELLTRYEKMLGKLEQMVKNKPVVTFERNKDGIKKMVPTAEQGDIKQKNAKRVAIETILNNNPVGKELGELIKSEKIPFISNYLESKGDMGEAINESIAYLETEMKKKKKQGGLFEKVARYLKADQGYEQMKKALKQLMNWKKYL